jgi:hypothetical protein
MNGVPKCLQIISNQGTNKELGKELEFQKMENRQIVRELDFKAHKNGMNSNISIKELNSKP